MKKYINFLNLIEVSLFLIILIIVVNLNINDDISLYFLASYWIIVLLFNMFYYTYNLIKKNKTPKISVYSPTALAAYFISWGGIAFVSIKNLSYTEFIKSSNDYQNMDKSQRIKSYLYYWLLWVVIALFLLFLYFDDMGVKQISAILLLFGLLILVYRIFMLYDYADRKEVKNSG